MFFFKDPHHILVYHYGIDSVLKLVIKSRLNRKKILLLFENVSSFQK